LEVGNHLLLLLKIALHALKLLVLLLFHVFSDCFYFFDDLQVVKAHQQQQRKIILWKTH
jgi:hypothetical protein